MDPRPLPKPDYTTRFFWEAASAGRLVLQKCRSCHKLQYPPDVSCVHCQEELFDEVEVAGRGSIYSYAVVGRPLHAGFVNAVPYIVALVELEEQPGVHMLTNIVGVPSDAELYCGMPVQVEFEERGALTLPQFRPQEPFG